MTSPSDRRRHDATDHGVPVTVLTAFLGTGKTTLLNAVLAKATVGPIAVMVNEFGEAGLDHDLIDSIEDEIVLMQSGGLPMPSQNAKRETQMIDVAIIGGSFAGLTAALQLGRASRTAVVLDAGRPRNVTSPAAHGVPGWDGLPPGAILDAFRADVAAYPTVRIRPGSLKRVGGAADGFTLDTSDGRIEARRIILAHGVRDTLPAIPGLEAGWGRTVLHCPYCHGYEVKGQLLAVLATGPMAAHQARLLRADWSDRLTVLTGLTDTLDAAALEAAGIGIEPRRVARVRHGSGVTLVFDAGPRLEVAALFVAPAVSLSGSPAEMLELALADGPMGPYVRVGQMMQTSRPGVFAAGDLARPAPSVNFAIGDGAAAGTACHQSLVFPDLVQPVLKEAA